MVAVFLNKAAKQDFFVCITTIKKVMFECSKKNIVCEKDILKVYVNE